MKIIDNSSEKLIDSLINKIKKGDKLSVAASAFTIYAYNELREQLCDIEEFRILITEPAFLSEKQVKSNEDALLGIKEEIRLKNELNQCAIVREFVEWLKKDSVSIRANKSSDYIGGFVHIEPNNKAESTVYAPLHSFTTVELGKFENQEVGHLIQELEMPFSKQYLSLFETIWKDKKRVVDIKGTIIKTLESVCEDNSPEYIYYVALHSIFSQFLSDISEDDYFANEKVGYKNSIIWNKLFDFQKDAALAIINKLERYNGCILADSVGLGKTYTALAVIKYYESRNKNVLVLCPKKLSSNWNTFRGNFINNPLLNDKFRYDVLYHTDLSRTNPNAISNGIELGRLNWGNYDLLIIDESHNFRNGGNNNSEKLNRYQILINKVIRAGVNTKVLMLSATPVNNRFNDLKNQLQLAYKDGESIEIERQLDTKNTVDGIFKKAQSVFNKWSSFEAEKRTTKNLLSMLDFDFFELLDGVTIARSRKHIKNYYDTDSIGAFPQRLSPISISPNLTSIKDAPQYDEIFNVLLQLSLSIYTPSHYIRPERRPFYVDKFGEKLANSALTQENREQGLRRLMAINLMKRLESSIWSFSLTLERIYNLIDGTIRRIENYQQFKLNTDDFVENYLVEDYDEDYSEDDIFSIGKKIKINFKDMNLSLWKETLEIDRAIFKNLKSRISIVKPKDDNKLKTLVSVIKDKISNPINNGNKKILIFTAFADTAEYLYDCVSKLSKELGIQIGLVTGSSDGKCTIPNLHTDFNTLLTCFSPISKERSVFDANTIEGKANIDILIGTDCISEGQNLQDCDYCINYDIHWNPVRIIQRYGRIDRIGSKNSKIQLVNFWPDVSLDEYINLKQKVETRMKIVNITATPEEKVLSNEEQIDLEYRKIQLEKLKTEVIDVEEMTSGVSMTDLGLNDFKLDLLDFEKNRYGHLDIRNGLYAIVKNNTSFPNGVIFVLKNIKAKTKIKNQNRLHPYYIVYVSYDGTIVKNCMDAKESLSIMKYLCKGNTTLNDAEIEAFNEETDNGKNMSTYKKMLSKAIESIVEIKKENDIKGLFRVGGTDFNKNNKIVGIDDFELICFMVVK